MNILVGVLLTVCAIEDLRTRKIPVWLPIGALVLGVILRVVEGTLLSWDCALGVLVGILFMVLAILSRQQMGLGDGLVLTICGLCIGWERLISLVFCAMLLFLVVGVMRMMCRKLKSRKQVPFIPFLWVVFMVSRLVYP